MLIQFYWSLLKILYKFVKHCKRDIWTSKIYVHIYMIEFELGNSFKPASSISIMENSSSTERADEKPQERSTSKAKRRFDNRKIRLVPLLKV